jgi:hypothetical protein
VLTNANVGSAVMSNPNSRKILECYRLAAEARRIADAATDQFERADLLEVEQRWLSLARSADLWQQTDRENFR